MKTPFVYIVGAGPGDVELLTLKSHRLLTSVAEVVVYDRLISEEIMALVPPHIEKIYAGKSCRNHHMTQEEIHQTLLEQAQLGKIIVRLKGGDPFIFGRGGEEAAFLASHNIPYEVVPGISAASACSSLMGVPLTHRGLANGVHYITGHSQKGVLMQLDWPRLADPNTTLVVYMGLVNLGEITRNLMLAGMDGSTPVIAIQEATTPKQRHLVGTVVDIHEKLQEHHFEAPTLIIIGRVVELGLWGK